MALMSGEESVAHRGDMALAAYFSGVGLANAGLGLVHGYASPLGARHDVPHGVVCGVLVGPVTAAVVRALAAAGEEGREGLRRYAEAAEILGVAHAGDGPVAHLAAGEALAAWLAKRAEGLGRLADYGFTAAELPELAAASGMKNTPVALDEATRTAILQEVL